MDEIRVAWEKWQIPDGTIFAIADIVVDSLDGEATIWCGKLR